jgi:hypothetical protein
VLTGEIASNTEIGHSFVQLWGGPAVEAVWIPQIYRRILAGAGVN